MERTDNQSRQPTPVERQLACSEPAARRGCAHRWAVELCHDAVSCTGRESAFDGCCRHSSPLSLPARSRHTLAHGSMRAALIRVSFLAGILAARFTGWVSWAGLAYSPSRVAFLD